MTDQITLEVEGHRVEVDRSFLDLSPAQQNATVEEIAASLGPKESAFDTGMAQLNTGIAETLGGAVDFVNPFDQPHALNPLKEGTGSATEGLRSGMEAIGVNTTDEAPEGLYQAMMRGTGQAAGSLPMVAGGANLLRNVGGVVGNIADDAYTAMTSPGGMAAEMVAGAGAGAGEQFAKDAGAPEWAQQAAAIGGGMTAAAPMLGAYAPSAYLARKGYGAAKKALMPYTKTGAREVAKERMQGLAGGEDRARELGGMVSEQPNEFGMTPAQQTGDPMMLAMEQAAASTDQNLRARLQARAAETNTILQRSVEDLGGNVDDAQDFLGSLRQDVKNKMEAYKVWADASAQAKRKGAQRSESENSQIVADEIRIAEQRALDDETQLWAAVPRDEAVDFGGSRSVAEALIENTYWPQESDIPGILKKFASINEPQTVGSMHSLYSELRRVARSAMAGSDQNKNRARMANEVAEAVLKDLGAVDASTASGRAINRAREFSAQMHETFDRGTIGRLLKRTLDGDEQINPQETLGRSIGQTGVKGKVAQEQIDTATQGSPRARQSSEDYVAGVFDRTAFGPDGEFNRKAALNFMRDRKELLDKFPLLRVRMSETIQAQDDAKRVAERMTARQTAIDDPRNPVVSFIGQPPRKAVSAVFEAKSPKVAARELARQARKDKSGKALAGVKAAFSDKLITDSLRQIAGDKTLVGQKMADVLDDRQMASALTEVFSPDEMRRLKVIRDAALKMDAARRSQPDIGSVSSANPNRMIEFAVRIAAANHGARMGEGAAGLQTAQMASGAAKKILGRLTNDKAEQMIIDAIEDPVLFRSLLIEPQRIQLQKRYRQKITPYLTGTLTATGLDEGQS
ncbi:MAG: hypothetical protein RID23_16315 [Roseovarius sp.]